MTISWDRTDKMVHAWANRLGFDPHDVEWRVQRRDDGSFVFTVGVDSEDGLAVVPFRAALASPDEYAVAEALAGFRKRVNPGWVGDE